MVPTPAQNSISTYAQCSIIRKKNCKLGNRGGTGTQTPGFGYPQYRGAHWRCCGTLKNHQILQKLGKKWRKAVFNLPLTHFSTVQPAKIRISSTLLGKPHCLSQRLKSTFIEIFSNRVAQEELAEWTNFFFINHDNLAFEGIMQTPTGTHNFNCSIFPFLAQCMPAQNVFEFFTCLCRTTWGKKLEK